MNLIERYIFRRATRLTLVTLGATTLVVLITQVLLYVNVLTDSGQAIGTFLMLAGFMIPAMSVLVAPFALLIGSSQTLSQMNADSELAVIEAAGGSRKITAKPILALGVIITIVTFGVATFVEPWSNRQIRTIVLEASADLVRLAVQSGQFKRLGDNLYIQIAEQLPGGTFGGIFIVDSRDEKTELIYYARRGVIIEQGDRELLVMSEGEIQRKTLQTNEVSVIEFASYAIDFSQFGPASQPRTLLPKEQSTAFLLDPDPNDHFVQFYPHLLRSELHRRFSEWLYPLAFALMAVYFAGSARSNRQQQMLGIAAAATTAVALRGLGFFAGNASGSSPAMAALAYVVPLGAILIFAALLVTGRQIQVPAWLTRRGAALLSWLETRGAGLRARTERRT